MKRRSPRPFAVEIKTTRTSRASLTVATTHLRAGKLIQRDWATLVAASEPIERRRSVEMPRQEQSNAPVRRVLPTLVPMFGLSNEPDPQVEVTEPKLPRVRRPRTKAEPTHVTFEPSFPQKPTETFLVEPMVAKEVASQVADLPAPILRVEVQPARSERASRRETGLRPGEHWKRRLPHFLR